MSDETTTTERTFMERRRDAALEEWARISRRDGAVANIVRSKGVASVNEIVTIEDGDGATTGAFVAEVTSHGRTVWLVVRDGVRSTGAWYTRQMAILHLLAIWYGDGDDMGGAAQYAARVLGIKDEI